MRGVVFALAGAALALCIAPAQLRAATYSVAGSGVWIAGAPSTPYSEPGESYAFSFSLPKAFAPDWYSSPDIAGTTHFTNFKYYLSGVLVPGAPQDIAFFDASLFGGLQLGYSAAYSIEFIGAPLATNFSQPTVTLHLGRYSEYPNLNYLVDAGGAPVNQGMNYTMSVVPEPAAWALLFLGIAGVGARVRAGRSRAATA